MSRPHGFTLTHWSDAEKALLKRHYGSKTDDELVAMLPQRTKRAVKTMRGLLGLWRRRRWSLGR